MEYVSTHGDLVTPIPPFGRFSEPCPRDYTDVLCPSKVGIEVVEVDVVVVDVDY